jgi:hypothetical protein
MYSVVTFMSTAQAMRAEKISKAAGFEVKLIPTPRHLSADCGNALRCNRKDKQAIADLFKEKVVDYSELVDL